MFLWVVAGLIASVGAVVVLNPYFGPRVKLATIKAVPVKKEKETGESPVYRNVRSTDRLIDEYQGMKTLDALFRYCGKKYGDLDCIGMRQILPDGKKGDYVFQSYKKTLEDSENLARALYDIGVQPKTNVGFYAPSSVSWKLAEIASYLSSIVIVSLYDTLGASSVEFIVDHSELSTCFCAPITLPKLLSVAAALKAKGKPVIKRLILFCTREEGKQDDVAANISKGVKEGIEILYLPDLIERGAGLKNITLKAPEPEDLCSIMYTSGTTGVPKGVMLSHNNVLSFPAGAEYQFGQVIKPADPRNKASQNSGLSYLPLAHIMQRVGECYSFLKGSKTAYFSGVIATDLLPELQKINSSGVTGVPRIYQRIYDKIMEEVNALPPVKRFLFNFAYEQKRKALQSGRDTPLWNLLVFNKIKEKVFGKALQTMTTGSAPLSAKVHEFMRIVFTPLVAQGYGLTETTAGCALQGPDDWSYDNCGAPHPACEFKLVDIPEMNYYATDKPCPRGEIWIRGPTVSKGYYKEPEKTAESFDADGWFHSGDVGRVNQDGTLSIIDRKKNIFKLSQGEYIAPEYLEAVFARSSLIAQVFIYGDSSESHVVAVAIPDEAAVKKKFPEKSQKTLAELAADQSVVDAVLKDMERVGKEAKLNSLEFPKALFLDSHLWTVENEILTHTLKLKRNEARKKYENEIKDLYEKVKKIHQQHHKS